MSKMILIEEAKLSSVLEALEEIHPGNMTPIAEEAWKKAITAMREALAQQPAQHRSTGKQSLQVERPAWPAPLLQSKQNFERNFGQHWQADWIYSDLAELIDSPPPEQPATTKCWKCGDADPAFTDVCQVPACGMREQP